MIQNKATGENIFFSFSDLPQDKFFVIISEKLNKLIFKHIIKKSGSIPKFARSFMFNQGSLYRWRKIKQYPLFLLLKLLKILDMSPKLIQSNLIALKTGYNHKSCGGGTSRLIYPQFPIFVSKELVRVIGHLMGDGMLFYDKRGYMNVTYFNQDILLREEFKEDIKKIFGNIVFSEGINKSTPFVSLPAPIGIIIFLKISDFYCHSCSIPSFIKDSNKIFKKEFLKVFFDDECHVRYSPPDRNIELALSNYRLLSDLREILIEFEINVSNITRTKTKGFDKFTFYIRNYHNIKKFADEIGLLHQENRRRLLLILSNPGRKSFARGETKLRILRFLKEKDLTSEELSKKLERTIMTARYWLNVLRKEGKIYKADIRKVNRGKEIVWSLK